MLHFKLDINSNLPLSPPKKRKTGYYPLTIDPFLLNQYGMLSPSINIISQWQSNKESVFVVNCFLINWLAVRQPSFDLSWLTSLLNWFCTVQGHCNATRKLLGAACLRTTNVQMVKFKLCLTLRLIECRTSLMVTCAIHIQPMRPRPTGWQHMARDARNNNKSHTGCLERHQPCKHCCKSPQRHLWKTFLVSLMS